MAYCSDCGAQVQGGGRFCTKCGAAMRRSEVALGDAPLAAVPYSPPSAMPAQRVNGTPFPQQNTQFNPTINVNVAQVQPSNTVVVVGGRNGPSILVRAIWFLFIGLWLGAFWMAIAWLLNLTIIGLPLGLMMINRVPQVMTLKASSLRTTVILSGSTTVVTTGVGAEQRSFLLRAVFFLLIGWWFSGFWMAGAWVAAALIITLPLAFWMFDRVPAVTTLRIT